MAPKSSGGGQALSTTADKKKKPRRNRDPLPEKLIFEPRKDEGLSRRELIVRGAIAGGLVTGGTTLGLLIRGRDDGWDSSGGGAITRSYVSKNPIPPQAFDLASVKL